MDKEAGKTKVTDERVTRKVIRRRASVDAAPAVEPQAPAKTFQYIIRRISSGTLYPNSLALKQLG